MPFSYTECFIVMQLNPALDCKLYRITYHCTIASNIKKKKKKDKGKKKHKALKSSQNISLYKQLEFLLNDTANYLIKNLFFS